MYRVSKPSVFSAYQRRGVSAPRPIKFSKPKAGEQTGWAHGKVNMTLPKSLRGRKHAAKGTR